MVALLLLAAVAAPAAEPSPAPAPADDPQMEVPAATSDSIGLAPGLPQYGNEVESAGARGPATIVAGQQLRFHGFMRAPMRIGFGPRNDGFAGDNEWHSPPRVPDGAFTSWTYLDNLPGPWSELMFSYGGERAEMTVSLAGYNQTAAGYRELQSQLGINQAFVTLRFPEVFGRFGGLVANVGSFTGRYGTAGTYDAGMYETYLFGRTRVAGETLTATLNLTRDLSLALEHGVGAKLDVIPFVTVTPRPEYLPYPGPEPQGSTFLHHAHVQLSWRNRVSLGAHYLHSFSPDDRDMPMIMARPGHMTVTGAEVRLRGGVAGDGYLGFSRIDAVNVRVVADAIEVLHSLGGWQFKNNYFGRFDPRTGTPAPDVTGRVDSVLFQYALSLGQIARYPARFWGRGPDLVATVFGMANFVTSASNSHTMLKLGGDLLYTPLSCLGIGTRYDLVRPDSRDANQSFAVVSPRIVIKTNFIAHERVILQYSRYFLGSAAYPAFPYETTPRADGHVVMISGSMWW